MTILRYLFREISQFALVVLLLLVIIFASQQFLRYLHYVVEGELAISFLLRMLALLLPVVISFVLPLAFFIASLFVLGRWHVDREMVVLHACGVSEQRLAAMILVPGMGFAILVALLGLWMTPRAFELQDQIWDQQKSVLGAQLFSPGRFHEVFSGQGVFYMESWDKQSNFQKVFLAKLPSGETSVTREFHTVTADVGYWTRSAGQEFLVLEKGRYYEGMFGRSDFTVGEFGRYVIELPESGVLQERRKMRAIPSSVLRQVDHPAYQAEWQWRFALAFSVPLLALLAIPLSRVQPRQGRIGRIIPALLIYLSYMGVLMMATEKVATGAWPVYPGLWAIHGLMASIALVWLWWDVLWRQWRRVRENS